MTETLNNHSKHLIIPKPNDRIMNVLHYNQTNRLTITIAKAKGVHSILLQLNLKAPANLRPKFQYNRTKYRPSTSAGYNLTNFKKEIELHLQS